MKRAALLLIGLAIASVTAFAQDPEPAPSVPVVKARLAAASSDTARLFAKLALADSYLYHSDSIPKAMDTARQYLAAVRSAPATNMSPQLKGRYYLITARALRVDNGQNNHDSAMFYIRLAIETLQPFPLDYGKSFAEAGYILLDAKDAHEDSLQVEYFKKAIAIFERLGAKAWLASTLDFLGGAIRNPKEGLPYLLRSLEVYRSVPNSDLRRLYSHVARQYNRLGNQEQALHYILLAVRIEDSLPGPDMNSTLTFNEAAVIHSRIKNYEKALIYDRKALDAAIKYQDLDAIHVLSSNMVKHNFRIGKYEEALKIWRWLTASYEPKIVWQKIMKEENFALIFQKMNRLDSMKPYIRRLAKIAEGLSPNDDRLPEIIMLFARYDNQTHQYTKAKKESLDLIRLGNTLSDVQTSVAGYGELSKADSALGNYQASINEYQQYVRLNDSLSDVANAKKIAELNLQYETEKKDKDIQSLNHKQELTSIAIRQSAETRNFLIAGAALILILIGVFINRYRLKKRSTKKLDKLINEKEFLLKEVHHRVKNNLQVSMSLLNSQAHYLDNEKAQNALRQSRNRMYAMSLIHQWLYQNDNLDTIDMKRYIPELVDFVRDSFQDSTRIGFNLQIQPLRLDVAQAVNIGLLINEAVSNAIKFAFTDQPAGYITIDLHKESADESIATLTISDNGAGLPPSFNLGQKTSLGIQLIQDLVTQIDGTIDFRNDSGLKIIIRFKPRYGVLKVN